MGERRRRRTFVSLILVVTLHQCLGIEHNLPDNVELVDPKDLGLDTQIDLDKLLGNVKALPIDTSRFNSGKPGLKTQVLTVGFDGSEGLNLDDFELPHNKNDEHAPLAQEAFSSFKRFLQNNTGSTQYGERVESAPQPPTPPPVETSFKTVQRPGGKRRTMMKRRKIVRVNATTTQQTPTEPPQPVEIDARNPYKAAPSSSSPKVIELDPSQIEKLIASGKIGPPKSLTPGGPQVIELGQKDLDALLSSENADEIKQILESGDTLQNFDISQLSGGNSGGERVTVPQQQELPVTTARYTDTYSPISHSSPVTSSPTTSAATSQTGQPEATVPTTSPTIETTTGLPIIFQYSSSQDDARQGSHIPPQGIQGSIPLQFFSSHANGQQQARLVKTPTFELISAPPVSFSSSVLPSITNNVISQQQQQQPQSLFIQPTYHQSLTQFVPISQPIQQQQSQQQFQAPSQKPSQALKESVNKLIPAPQTSSHTEQVNPNSISNANYLQSLHKVNLPLNSVNPSPQLVQTVLNQVPPSFQPSLVANHVVNSPVPDPLNFNNQNIQNSFIRTQPVLQQNNFLEPFRNTQLFGAGPSVIPTSRPPPPPPVRSPPPPRAPPGTFRFPTTSGILSSPGGPGRFRTSESSNPFFNFQQGSFGNLALNSFVAGDGLNYGGKSSDGFQSPGI